MAKQTYCIVRFFKDKDSEIRQRGLTLAQAQAHCRREDTHGDDWFDGYSLEQTGGPEFEDHVESCPVCKQAVFNPQ